MQQNTYTKAHNAICFSRRPSVSSFSSRIGLLKKKVLTKYVPSAAKLKTIECSPHFSYGSYDTQQFLSRSEKQSISRTAGSKILTLRRLMSYIYIWSTHS